MKVLNIFWINVLLSINNNAHAFLAPSQLNRINYDGQLTKPVTAARSTSILYAVNNQKDGNVESSSSYNNPLATWLVGAWMSFATCFALVGPAVLTTAPQAANAAAEARVVGQLKGSGLVFKDILQVESIDDPKVKGVTLYISNFQRPLTERLTSNFLTDPSAAGLTCAKTGKIAIADNIAKGPGGEEVFEESKSLLFKTLRVQRIYDEEKNTVVYVVFNTRLDKSDDSNRSRFKSNLCAVSLYEPPIPEAVTTPVATTTPAPVTK